MTARFMSDTPPMPEQSRKCSAFRVSIQGEPEWR